MSDRVIELLLKAVRGLSQDEQDEVLGTLLRGQLTGSDAADELGVQPPGTPSSSGFSKDLSEQARRDVIQAMDTRLKVLPVRLPEGDYERLRKFAQDQGFSMAVVVRTLVERFLNQHAA
jgi:hypothetical protein